MATVVIQKRKRKKGFSYAIRYADPISDKKKHYKTFRVFKEAQQAANDLRTVLDLGKPLEEKKRKLSPLNFSEVAESLKAEWGSRLKIKELSQKTYKENCIWLNVLNRTFGNEVLCKITTDELVTYRDNQAEKNSNVTANRYLLVLRDVFKQGIKLNAIFDNPAAEVKLLSEDKHKRNKYLLPEKLDKVIGATQEVRAKYYLPAIIYLGAEHGASKQEILSLEWSDIDFDLAEKGQINLFRTKNGKERTEVLMPRTKKALLEWRDHLRWMRHRKRIAEVKSDSVFCRLDGTPIKGFYKAWWRVLELAGIEDFHFHDLRHTFCSNLVLSGANLKEVKEMIGHSDISMTDRYSHLSDNHKTTIQDRLAEHYSNGTRPKKSSKPE